VRPEAAPPEVLRPKAAASLRASRRAWHHDAMACYRTATDSHAEKRCSGAGGAGAAAGRVVSGAAAEGRSTAAREQTCVMSSEQI
jgi:hypothetical protein